MNKDNFIKINSFKNREITGPEIKIKKTHHEKLVNKTNNMAFIEELVSKHKRTATSSRRIITGKAEIFNQLKDFTVLYRKKDQNNKEERGT